MGGRGIINFGGISCLNDILLKPKSEAERVKYKEKRRNEST